MNHHPTPLASLLGRCLDRVVGTDGATTIWRAWEEAVGSQIARRAQPVRLRGRTLIVAVSSAPWMQELQLLKPRLRDAINAQLARPLVGDLFFVLSEELSGAAPADTAIARPTVKRCAPAPARADLSELPEPLRRGFASLLAAWQRRSAAS